MTAPRGQFRVLYRDFLLRMVDFELLSPGGDIHKLFAQFAALLGAFSFVLAIYMTPQYAFTKLTPERLALAAWGDQEFLIATTMAIVGMFAVMSWDSMFPDRRDIAVLGVLPVSPRTMFSAKAAAIAAGLSICIAAVNLATGLSYPVAVSPPGALALLRAFGAYWTTMAAAGAFVFFALLSIQGVAAQLLSYRLFLRVSNFLQMGAFFLILGVYFLTPGPAAMSITAPENRAWLARLPSFWFLGLFQQLNGRADPLFGELALRAVSGLAIASALSATAYALAYFRTIRRILEQPDIVPADRSRPAGRLAAALLAKLLPRPLESAILLFAARTLSRSRQHRTILAAYAGIGLAISLTYAKVLLYGNSQLYASLRTHITVPRWREPNVPLMAAGFVMLCFAVAGTRAVFSLPASLKANWIFRLTAVHPPRTYFGAVRKSLYVLAALPVWTAAALLYYALWPAAPVTAHLLALAAVGIILVERALYEFRKIPFACSYLPGGSDIKRKLAIYGTLFLVLTDAGTRIEHWSLQSRSRGIVLGAILAAAAWRSRNRWAGFAAAPYQRLQFEDAAAPEVSPLDLRRDGIWSAEHFAAAPDAAVQRPWRARMLMALRRAAVGVMAAAAIGVAYEQYGQWRHEREFPRIGQAVDIGGRSLNISCSGEGGPAVIFESGAGGPGYAWVSLQRAVSRYTRACWYDRAGYGWSDSAPYPRHSAASAADLHQLLRAAGVAPPYVLVGASYGGFHVRVYSGLYPGEVAGLVLVDSSHIDEREPIRPRPPWLSYGQSLLAQTLRRVGLLRVFMDGYYGPPPAGVRADEWRVATSFEPRTFTENAKELFLESALQARAVRNLGDRPLIVLTAGLPSRQASNPVEARQALAQQQQWIRMQAQLARLSTRGVQRVVTNSGHCIQCDAPQAVLEAIREVVTACGGRASDAAKL